jgi:hypothetical protein
VRTFTRAAGVRTSSTSAVTVATSRLSAVTISAMVSRLRTASWGAPVRVRTAPHVVAGGSTRLLLADGFVVDGAETVEQCAGVHLRSAAGRWQRQAGGGSGARKPHQLLHRGRLAVRQEDARLRRRVLHQPQVPGGRSM